MLSPSLMFSCPGRLTFPSVVEMTVVFPDLDGPCSFERSTVIVRTVPLSERLQFFMMMFSCCVPWWRCWFEAIREWVGPFLPLEDCRCLVEAFLQLVDTSLGIAELFVERGLAGSGRVAVEAEPDALSAGHANVALR